MMGPERKKDFEQEKEQRSFAEDGRSMTAHCCTSGSMNKRSQVPNNIRPEHTAADSSIQSTTEVPFVAAEEALRRPANRECPFL